MDDARARRLIQRGISRGIVSAAEAHEAVRRHAALAGKGDARPMLDVLAEVANLDAGRLAALDDRSLVGRSIGGFEIVAKIGEGATGAVYRAKQRSLARTVALKVLDPELAGRPGVLERFGREARAAARLDHPNVVQPIDCGEDGGFAWFAMELMEGGSAAGRIEERGPFSEREAVEVAIAIARALEFAAKRGIVHRDVKPDNLLFTATGIPKLGDLGLALVDRGAAPLTEPGLIVGTPEYMAPEQVRGRRDLDGRTDIYALGISLFEMVTGVRPFDGPDPIAIGVQQLNEPLPDPRAHAPVSEAFAAVLARMTAKAREQRFASATDLAAALESVLAGKALPAGPPPVPAAPSAPATGPDPARPPAPSRRPLGLALGVAAIIGAIVIYAMLPAGGPPRRDPEAEAARANAVRDLLLARKKPDGTFGWSASTPSDPWTAAQAAAALGAAPDPAAHAETIAANLAYLRRTALAAGGTLTGWRAAGESDNVACAESTAWAAIAIALGRGSPDWPSEERARVRAAVRAAQQESGGLASVPAAGEPAVRTSATALGVLALAALDAADPEAPDAPETAAALARAAAWLGRSYDVERRSWPPDPAGAAAGGGDSWRAREPVPGLGDLVAIVLLEAELALAKRGRALPGEARAALEHYAAHFAPLADPRGSALGVCDAYDYTFSLPPGARATLPGFRVVAPAWRLLAAERLAARPGPRALAWAVEAARLGALAPAADLGSSFTFQLAEVLFAWNLGPVPLAERVAARRGR